MKMLDLHDTLTQILHFQKLIMAQLSDFQPVLDKISADIAALKAIPASGLSAADEATLLADLTALEASLASLIPAAPIVPPVTG